MGHRAIAVANQKGGVAKTTTVHALGTALAERGHRVLLIDLDPQACLSYSAGENPDALDLSLHDVMLGRADVDDVLLEHADGVDIVPSTIDMAGAEVHLMGKTGREHVLRQALEPVAHRYGYVLIDCPPSLGLLTINGLTAAEEVLIPLQCDTLSHRGVGQLLQTVADVRAYTNPGLRVLGAVATLYDGRTRLAHEVVEQVTATYDLEVLPPPIPKTVRAAEAPGRGLSVLHHAPRSTAAIAYRDLAASVEERRVTDHPDPKGRKALFEQQPGGPDPPAEDGRRAFYSPADPGPQPGEVPVHCSRCDERSYVTRRELAKRVAMFTLWAPWRDHSRWIRCPACNRRAWCRVSWV